MIAAMKRFEDLIPNLPSQAVVLCGVPWDEKSSFVRGAANAPGAIREAMYSDARHITSENGVNLAQSDRFVDLGDMPVPSGDAAISAIADATRSALGSDRRLIALGGDHAITVPILRELKKAHGEFDVLQIDAHADLYHDYEGDLYSHACPFARAMEEGLCKRLVQVGIRTMNTHLLEQAKRFGTEVITMRDFDPAQDFRFERPVYLSIDLDGLDPAFAPGVAHHEPGGMSTRDALRVISGVSTSIIGADIVEYQPALDINHMTAAVAAKLTKEIAGQMLIGE